MASLQATRSSEAMVNGKVLVLAKASITNTGVGALKFQEKKDWSGSIVGTYPHNIDKNRTVEFSHRGVPPKDFNGSMGGVIYVGPNVQGGENNCAWVLAWSSPGDSTQPNKIYVESGHADAYPSGNVDWDGIKAKLEESTEESESKSEDTGAEATASITKNTIAPKATVSFSVDL